MYCCAGGRNSRFECRVQPASFTYATGSAYRPKGRRGNPVHTTNNGITSDDVISERQHVDTETSGWSLDIETTFEPTLQQVQRYSGSRDFYTLVQPSVSA